MPRPNILPDIPWAEVFASGQEYNDWRVSGEKPEHQEKMEEFRNRQEIAPEVQRALQAIARPVHVLVMAEDWCPDVVRHVPVLECLAAESPHVKTAYIRRDTYPEVTARFHTNGTESVPKFGFFNDAFVWCGVWGPLPEACNELIRRGRACGDLKTARQHVAALYKADRGRDEVIRELLHCIEVAASPPLPEAE